MKLATCRKADGRSRAGVVEGDQFYPFIGDERGGSGGMLAVIEGGGADLARRVDAARCGPSLPLSDCVLAAPVPRPPEFIGVGLNYMDHAIEAGLAIPAAPLVFNKQTSSASGPHDDVLAPVLSDQLDYEGELGVVIGNAWRGMSLADARKAIFGYVVVNDFSLRDIQMASPTHTMGKSFDTHGPFGPWIVTADEVDDPQALLIETRVNGELRQRGSTAEMIFGCAEIVSHLSRVMTLAHGTVVTTGTPAGVCYGGENPAYLRDGDTVTVEIKGIGLLRNRVVAERRASS